jgi:hypothetical protein
LRKPVGAPGRWFELGTRRGGINNYKQGGGGWFLAKVGRLSANLRGVWTHFSRGRARTPLFVIINYIYDIYKKEPSRSSPAASDDTFGGANSEIIANNYKQQDFACVHRIEEFFVCNCL